MASTIIYLSDCTPLYTTLGAPERIPVVNAYPLFKSVRLEWQAPPNSDTLLVDSYIIRYKFSGAPLSQTISEILTFFPVITIPNLSNSVSYDFWVVAKNRFGESPHSPTITVTPGSGPSASQVMRRAFHSTVSGNGIDGNNPQKLGIEFTPSTFQNGATSLTFTVRYTRLNNGSNIMSDVSYTQVYSVQPNEVILDVSGLQVIAGTGFKGNYIRKEITPPTDATNPAFQSGNYLFQMFSSNLYGRSPSSDMSFVIQLYSNSDANSVGAIIPRFTSPSFSSYIIPLNGGIVGVDASDSLIRFRWKQYRGQGTGSTGVDAYSGWYYRIQYTNDKDNWYYPSSSLSEPLTTQFIEYTRAYDRTSNGSNTADFEYFIDISHNIINGQRYYVRYCVVSASGDTSQYTEVTTSNLTIVSNVPGKRPFPPQIFRANSTDRKVRLYFDWSIRPPKLEDTGGMPIIDYRIVRYIRSRENGVIRVLPETYIVFDNIIGPFYEDTYEIDENGIEYEYRVYSRNIFGLSIDYISVNAVPSRPSDVIPDVGALLNSGEITLFWDDPETIETEAPISQYFIEYKEFDLFSVSSIPSPNVHDLTPGQTTIQKNIQDMNKIYVTDSLWDAVKTNTIGIYTNSMLRSYTFRNFIENVPFIFRIAAVTQDRARRRIVGLRKVIGTHNPYLPYPVIIGKIPGKLTGVEYTNADSRIIITWSSKDVYNSEGILRFIVDYDIAPISPNEPVYSQRQIFEYGSSILLNDFSSAALFQIVVTGLNNNVTEHPDPRTNSYVMKVYSENSVSYTNEQNKVKLHDERSFTDNFEGILVTRVLRPRTIPLTIQEVRI